MLKVKTKKVYILFVLLLFIKTSVAQNFIEDFKKINLAYTTGSLSFDIKFDYYNDHNQKAPSYFVTGNVKIKGSMIYYKMDDIELAYDTSYTCILDHGNKTIMIDTVYQKSNMIKKISFIDSLSQSYQSVSYKDLGGNKSEYTIYSNLPGISHSVIVFNKSTYLIQTISIFFLDNRNNAKKGSIRNKLIIKYSNVNDQPIISNMVFQPSQFLMIKGRIIKPKEKYKQYILINNLKSNKK